MNEDKQKKYEEEKKKSQQGNFKTSFYYVDTTVAESLGVTEYKSKKGDNFIRIVTPNIKEFWALEIWKHGNIGANRATFLCMDKMFGEDCPICNKIKELKAADSSDPNIKPLYPSRRCLAFLYDVTSDTSEKEGLRWYDMPTVIKDNLMSLCEDKRKGTWIEIEHPSEGRDIEFERSGTGLNTKYSGFKLVPNDPNPKSWSENIPDFEDILLIPDPAVIAEELLGMPASEEATEKSSRRSSRGVSQESVEKEPEGTSRRRHREAPANETAAVDESTPGSETEIPEEESQEELTSSRGGDKLSAVKQKIADMKAKREAAKVKEEK